MLPDLRIVVICLQGWQRHPRMDLNGVMLGKEHAVFVVIPILILYCTGTPDCRMHA